MHRILHHIRSELLSAAHLRKSALRGFAGGALAIAIVGSLGKLTGAPLLIAPFGASSVLLFAAPDSAFAQSRNLIIGHCLATCVGLLVFRAAGAGLWQMAFSVGLAIALMQLTRSVHPPAGADPLVIMLAGGAPASFLLFPVLFGVLLLAVLAMLFNRVTRMSKPVHREVLVAPDARS